MKMLRLLAPFICSCAILCLPVYTRAQCSCSQPDPFGYSSTSCGLTDVTVNGSSGTCLASSCSATVGAYNYDVYFVSNTVTGYAYSVSGGVVAKEVITRGNSMSSVTRTDCGTYAQYGSVNYINHVTLTINWTSSSATNCLLIWGYTGIGAYPTTLSYFHNLQVSTNTAPAAPTGISVSSPVSWGICGWKVASYYVSNADSYTWYGAGSGTYNDITGPAVAENQNAYLCVRANNACASSSYYCAYVSIPNNTSCGGSRYANENPGPGIDPNDKHPISVSPNPVHGILTIYPGISKSQSIGLLSASGQLIKNISTDGLTRKDIDVSRLPAGVYLLSIRQKDGRAITRKIVIQ